ncbi:MAG: hypothetical protein MHM6MM_000195 [Cercozoa sp. M6MM]
MAKLEKQVKTILSAALGLPASFLDTHTCVCADDDLWHCAHSVVRERPSLLDDFALWSHVKQAFPDDLSAHIRSEWLGCADETLLQQRLAHFLRSQSLPFLLKKRQKHATLQLTFESNTPFKLLKRFVTALTENAKAVIQHTKEDDLKSQSATCEIDESTKDLFLRTLFVADENDDATRSSGCFDLCVRTPDKSRHVTLHVEQLCLDTASTKLLRSKCDSPSEWAKILQHLRLVVNVACNYDSVHEPSYQTEQEQQQDARFASRFGGRLFSPKHEDTYGQFLLQTRLDELPSLPGVGRRFPVSGLLVFLSDEDEGSLLFDKTPGQHDIGKEENDEEELTCPLVEVKDEKRFPCRLSLSYGIEVDTYALEAENEYNEDFAFDVRAALEEDALLSGVEPFLSFGGYSRAVNSPDAVPRLKSLLAEVRETDNDVLTLTIGDCGCLTTEMTLCGLEHGEFLLGMDDAR